MNRNAILRYKYDFAPNGDCIGYAGWDASNKPIPNDNYVDQLPPTDSLTDNSGNNKYKRDDKNPKKIKLK